MTNSQLINSMDPEASAELHWRLAMVLLIPILGLLAIPFSESVLGKVVTGKLCRR